MQDPNVCDSYSKLCDFLFGSLSLSESSFWEVSRSGGCLEDLQIRQGCVNIDELLQGGQELCENERFCILINFGERLERKMVSRLTKSNISERSLVKRSLLKRKVSGIVSEDFGGRVRLTSAFIKSQVFF